jgi:hypothetical protein
MMNVSGGQLCARARFWASLRVDGELSELEGALLDAHLARCEECRVVAQGFAGAATMLRAAQPARLVPVAVDIPRSPRRLLGLVAVAAVLLLGVIGGSLVRGQVANDAASAPRVIAIVASSETPDEFRQLRRAALLNARKVPRDIVAEPV